MQQKRLFIALLGAAIITTGCTTVRDTLSSAGDIIPRAMSRTPLFFKIDVQQGNSIEQEKINRLQPGMSKNQVQFVMGTPLLVDVFHLDRWDYYYSMHRGDGDLETRRITLIFEDDRLVRTEGDMRPLPPTDDTTPLKEAEVYDVPDYTYKKGLLTRMLEATGLEEE